MILESQSEVIVCSRNAMDPNNILKVEVTKFEELHNRESKEADQFLQRKGIKVGDPEEKKVEYIYTCGMNPLRATKALQNPHSKAANHNLVMTVPIMGNSFQAALIK
ncbi:hypothetical protein CQW23_24270 [Capsicum baccatum]|uniref:Uncharacterized protein n=1 Tax=Capsicum baccatum TaxID=33114 RepID=A0A2G2VUA5_CAPBA|nr:hypothetical protein CQW23_24270 [Capsicum baccatum]